MPRTRLPLEIGVSALNNLVLGTILVPIGVAATIACLLLLWWTRFEIGEGLYIPGAIAGAGLGFGGYALVRAWRERPSDALFDDQGLQIEGGASHGARFAWQDIDPKRCELAKHTRTEPMFGSTTDDGFALEIMHRDAKVTLAVAEDDGDVKSLDQIGAAIIAHCKKPKRERAGRDVPLQLFVCKNCNAPLVPADADD